MNIKYCGPALDYSGYGEANRHDIGSLLSVGVDVVGEYTKHCLEISEFGELGELVRQCVDKKLDYQIKILHTTPNIYGSFIEPFKYHIGRCFWETDKLPPSFTNGLKMVQEIWTGSKYNADAIRKSGITDKPIIIIPEAISTPTPQLPPFNVPNEFDFYFYSIFEWTERKNPSALLEAYWQEFKGNKKVCLVIKTYVDNFTHEKRKEIRQNIEMIKKKFEIKDFPAVYISTQLMSRKQIYKFHKSFDCFISPHRGEGWGIPQMEALLLGKAIVSTNCGGIHEYLTHKHDSYLLDYKLIPIGENSRNKQWYLQDQNWADVEINEIRKALRWIYDSKDRAKKLGQNGKKTVLDKFSFKTVGQLMKNRLLVIENYLKNHEQKP